MRQSTKRFFSMIASLIFFIGAIVFYTQFTKPLYDDVQKLRGDEIGKQTVLENEKEAIEKVKNILEAYSSETELQSAVSAAIPLEPDVSGIISQFNTLAIRDRISIQSVTLGSSVLETAEGAVSNNLFLTVPASSLTFQLRFVGSYEDFKLFVKDVEENLRVFDVREITMQPAGKPEQDVYAFDVKIITYYQPPLPDIFTLKPDIQTSN